MLGPSWVNTCYYNDYCKQSQFKLFIKWFRFTDKKCDLEPDCLVLPINFRDNHKLQKYAVSMVLKSEATLTIICTSYFLFCFTRLARAPLGNFLVFIFIN